ncbi:hypothetical protein MSAN_01525000 [Mycena sanguinolenta]|uniref:Protein kinase domain-containing protein n=1 Tax=Mycena sanguinolenta TaxID=230812 RepID=A0A8H7CWR4_9AGAR|nr:hypothetical protein MSAN_01525000 [Mycena sanguinolenta]
MDLQLHPPEFVTVPTTNDAEIASYANAFFPHAAGFTIHGGVFTSNVTNNLATPASTQPFDFRTIRFGDINLMKEMRLNHRFNVVDRQNRRAGVRRIYTAKIRREPELVTVAIYEGNGHEEKWQQHVAQYESIRHPNILQLYGLVQTRTLRAMIFHDELIPYAQFLHRFQHSPILTAYIIGYCSMEWVEAMHYISSVSTDAVKDFLDFSHGHQTLWIRRTTGELCVDLVQEPEMNAEPPWWSYAAQIHLEDVSLDDPNAETAIISSVDEYDYHEICYSPPIAQFRTFGVSTHLMVRRGAMIFRVDSQHGTLLSITEPLDVGRKQKLRWEHHGGIGEVLPSSWIRYHSGQALPSCYLTLSTSRSRAQKSWLAQANYILSQCRQLSDLEAADYVCVDSMGFSLRCVPNTNNPDVPEGYLFVCPPEHFQTGRSMFRWPQCPAYWSLDASGTVRLSAEEARILGFPTLHLESVLLGQSWDNVVYEGLRRFHHGKGFNPDSQEAAIQLGYPLYELATCCMNCDAVVPLPYHDVESLTGEECDFSDVARCQELGHYL